MRLLLRKVILPCDATGDCPYEYDRESGRDVEGMPFSKYDPRSCPVYGHICPKFMEDFGLTIEELHVRAAIHCGRLLDYFVQTGEIDKKSDEYIAMIKEYERVIKKYPIDKYPKYY